MNPRRYVFVRYERERGADFPGSRNSVSGVLSDGKLWRTGKFRPVGRFGRFADAGRNAVRTGGRARRRRVRSRGRGSRRIGRFFQQYRFRWDRRIRSVGRSGIRNGGDRAGFFGDRPRNARSSIFRSLRRPSRIFREFDRERFAGGVVVSVVRRRGVALRRTFPPDRRRFGYPGDSRIPCRRRFR